MPEETSDGKPLLEALVWGWEVEKVLKEFDTSLENGLSSEKVETMQKIYGPNELETPPKKSFWKLVIEQFEDTLVRILLVAAVISFVLAYFEEDEHGQEKSWTQFVEPLVILAILIINAIVGVWQESSAESALDSLKNMQSTHAKVLRDSVWNVLSAKDLVPGDIVEIHVGDQVPADCRVCKLRTTTLRAMQASLTGESESVLKQVEAVAEQNLELQRQENMVFSGTAIANGTCLAVVTSTGMNTQIGRIQSSIASASDADDDTPLKRKLDEFGQQLTYVIGIVCLTLWLINYRQFLKWENSDRTFIPHFASLEFDFGTCTFYFKIAVALAVAAIPEGLPAVITTCLALGSQKMAKQNAIVRTLPSVETLGCTSVICSDKTGTLTTNQMSVRALLTPGANGSLKRIDVEGTTYDPEQGRLVDFPGLNSAFVLVSKVCALCNSSGIVKDGNTIKPYGSPTEAALKVLAEKLGVPDAALDNRFRAERKESVFAELCSKYWEDKYPKLATLEFDRKRKSMSVICKAEPAALNGGRVTRSQASSKVRTSLYTKGAPEALLSRCAFIAQADGQPRALTSADRAEIIKNVKDLSRKELRCIAFAIKETDRMGAFSDYDGEQHPAHKDLLDPEKYAEIETDLTFVGVAGILDPPRPEVSDSIRACKEAGIRVIVITGDNKYTAEAICKEIGVFDDTSNISEKSLTGTDLLSLPKNEQIHFLFKDNDGRVFSRVEPAQKQTIVQILKEQGEIVAMTGDGVNDAPALKLADIGVAMGVSGTEVAKEASDMVLADDNFSTIVSAVSEGRSIYNNMKAFIRYMISSNIGEVISIFLTSALGMPEAMIPVQLLWVNLVTDGPPATALGFNPPDVDIMKRPPRSSNEPLISTWVMIRFLVIGAYVGIATVGIFAVWYTQPSFMGIDLVQDGHSVVSWGQLLNWPTCDSASFSANSFTAGHLSFHFDSQTPNAYYSDIELDSCSYFGKGKVKASTLSLSVLVTIEMFNALNAISEDLSLFTMTPFVNPYLLVAMAVSFGLHFLIMYIAPLAKIFFIVPLSFSEWMLVILFASPVWLLEEIFKLITRSQRVKLAESASIADKKTL